MTRDMLLLLTLSIALAACGPPASRQPSPSHLQQSSKAAFIPPIVTKLTEATSGADKETDTEARYSVNVDRIPVRDLLFALARDAAFEIDIAPEITGTVTLNAKQQTLPSLLERISRQIPLRFEFTDKHLQILPDTPYLKHYAVDYPNLGRTVSTTVSNNMQIAAAGSNSTPGSLSSTRIDNTSQHKFWDSLEKNLKTLLSERQPASNSKREGDRSASESTLIVNAEAGLVSVFASNQQHRQIRTFIDRLANAARRQVLIEATIVEVALNEGHEQGIDWSSMVGGGLFELASNPLKNSVNLRYNRSDNPRALINLLQRFGTSKVLSSPRLSVLNNQSAILKVVENYVYFSVKADTTTTANVGTTVTYTTTPQTVSVGLVLGVTPQISTDDSVVLNIRPTITSIGREVPDPNPDLRRNGIENLVPMIRTREIESVMRVANGQIAVLGGLMEDRIDYQTARVPLLGNLPIAGEAFNNRNNRTQKTELVIFLRPLVIKEASLQGEYAEYSRHLPETGFFTPPAHSLPFSSLRTGP